MRGVPSVALNVLNISKIKAVKTGYPVRDGSAHDGFGLLRTGLKSLKDKQA
ncbi:hypothetical protein MTR_1g492740 [Medicago truncatula]|uniref:Uncharacterized protein n=1 Tax=Medicago truncatula TaxID=3880 RepID=A0A072VNQ3_MEDTR|nr:hypothetical protein MTR_1g492740 [Medicago truncatula]